VSWEELTTASKLLNPTYLKIKGNCSMKALKFLGLKYTGENTDCMRNVRMNIVKRDHFGISGSYTMPFVIVIRTIGILGQERAVWLIIMTGK
jgi:hypothetical protein